MVESDYNKALRVLRIWLCSGSFELIYCHALLITFELDKRLFDVLVAMQAIESHESQKDVYRAKERLSTLKAKEVINQLKSLPPPMKVTEGPEKVLPVKNKFGINPDDVEYCEAIYGNYTTVHFRDGKTTLLPRNLGLVCRTLELERPHKSFLIHPDCVLIREVGGIRLESGKVIPVSRRKEISPKQRKYELLTV